MRAQGAAPRGGTRGHGYIDGSAETLPDSVPAVIRERLREAGINTAADWLALGAGRFQLWGITRATVALIDRAWGCP